MGKLGVLTIRTKREEVSFGEEKGTGCPGSQLLEPKEDAQPSRELSQDGERLQHCGEVVSASKMQSDP